MATQTATANQPNQDLSVEQKLQKLREIYADAPEVGRVALEKIMGELEAPFETESGDRRSHRLASGQNLRTDLHRETQARRGEAAIIPASQKPARTEASRR